MIRKQSWMAVLLGLALIPLISGCVSVKEYQKMYLNDKDMELSDGSIEKFEGGFQTYREGASGADGGKSGGGCGCN